jgi:hypothetical protein
VTSPSATSSSSKIRRCCTDRLNSPRESVAFVRQVFRKVSRACGRRYLVLSILSFLLYSLLESIRTGTDTIAGLLFASVIVLCPNPIRYEVGEVDRRSRRVGWMVPTSYTCWRWRAVVSAHRTRRRRSRLVDRRQERFRQRADQGLHALAPRARCYSAPDQGAPGGRRVL